MLGAVYSVIFGLCFYCLAVEANATSIDSELRLTSGICSFLLLSANASKICQKYLSILISHINDVLNLCIHYFIGCPLEYYHMIKVVDPETGVEKNQPSAVGEMVFVKCREDPMDFIMLDFPDKFTAFPRDRLTCQSDGKWYEVPPICVDKERMMKSE